MRVTRTGRVALALTCPASERSCDVRVRLALGVRTVARAKRTIAGGRKATARLRLDQGGAAPAGAHGPAARHRGGDDVGRGEESRADAPAADAPGPVAPLLTVSTRTGATDLPATSFFNARASGGPSAALPPHGEEGDSHRRGCGGARGARHLARSRVVRRRRPVYRSGQRDRGRELPAGDAVHDLGPHGSGQRRAAGLLGAVQRRPGRHDRVQGRLGRRRVPDRHLPARLLRRQRRAPPPRSRSTRARIRAAARETATTG